MKGPGNDHNANKTRTCIFSKKERKGYKYQVGVYRTLYTRCRLGQRALGVGEREREGKRRQCIHKEKVVSDGGHVREAAAAGVEHGGGGQVLGLRRQVALHVCLLPCGRRGVPVVTVEDKTQKTPTQFSSAFYNTTQYEYKT